MSDIAQFSGSNGVTDALFNNTAQEVNNLYDFLKIEFEKYTQHKILYDILQDCVNGDLCNDPLRSKVVNKIMSKSCSQCTDIGYNSNGQTTDISLLGIKTRDEELSYTETIELKNIMNNRLKGKYKTIKDEFYKVTGKNIDDILTDVKETTFAELSADDKALLEYKQELSSEQNIYIENLLLQQDLLEEIGKLRLNALPKVTQQKIQECQTQTKMNLLRSRVAEEKMRVDIFTETNKSLDAYKLLIQDINKQKEELKKEIEELLVLKEKYKLVACKQFDDILASFLQYKMSIQKKRLLYDCLNS